MRCMVTVNSIIVIIFTKTLHTNIYNCSDIYIRIYQLLYNIFWGTAREGWFKRGIQKWIFIVRDQIWVLRLLEGVSEIMVLHEDGCELHEMIIIEHLYEIFSDLLHHFYHPWPAIFKINWNKNQKRTEEISNLIDYTLAYFEITFYDKLGGSQLSFFVCFLNWSFVIFSISQTFSRFYIFVNSLAAEHGNYCTSFSVCAMRVFKPR